ncbi:hypothetical protein ACI79C_07960 [Geodermatophilus sp. SYSU D00697]
MSPDLDPALSALADRLPGAPPDFADRAHAVLASLGTGPDVLAAAVRAAVGLVAEGTAAVSPRPPRPR